MQIYRKVDTLQKLVSQLKSEGKTIGFVPTMGALHQGHMSLVKLAKSHCDVCVVSIFVNPTQFNESSDLDNYPRTLREDIDLLVDDECDILFYPRPNEVYPDGLNTVLELDFGSLANVLEGEFRPGHFDGMAQVVSRLLDIVLPTKLFMGQKDYQQFTIVRSMLESQNRSTELVICPIIREEDGLAMSSRNRRLTSDYRQNALVLSRQLQIVKDNIDKDSIDRLESLAEEAIEKAGLKPEYFEIIDGKTLMEIKSVKDHKEIVACVAAWAGDVRLIDNMILKN